jgi:MFS family permease
LATLGTKNTKYRVGVSFLLLSGSIVGLNWLNLASIFPFIATDLKLNVPALGSMTALFVVGEGLFQIPAALVAGKYSQKKIIILGTIGASFSTLLIGAADSVAEFELLRFACAVATAFAYAPGYILIAKYFDRGKEGTATGLFAAAAVSGNIVALAVDTVLPVYIGWRMTIALNGVAGLLAGLSLITLPTAPAYEETKIALGESYTSFSAIKKIIFDKWILVICLVLTCLEIGSVVASNFMVYYLEKQLTVTPAVAGSIASLLPVLGVIATILFGRLYDKFGKARLLMLVSGVICSGGLGIAAIGNLASAAITSALVGFGNNAGYVVGVALAGKIASKERRLEVIGIAWTLSVSLLASFFAPILFSFLAVSFDYPIAWIGSALVMFVLLVPVVFVRSDKGKAEER